MALSFVLLVVIDCFWLVAAGWLGSDASAFDWLWFWFVDLIAASFGRLFWLVVVWFGCLSLGFGVGLLLFVVVFDLFVS